MCIFAPPGHKVQGHFRIAERVAIKKKVEKVQERSRGPELLLYRFPLP